MKKLKRILVMLAIALSIGINVKAENTVEYYSKVTADGFTTTSEKEEMTFREAMTARVEGTNYVTLQEDVDDYSTFTKSTTVYDNKDLVINLNGHSLNIRHFAISNAKLYIYGPGEVTTNVGSAFILFGTDDESKKDDYTRVEIGEGVTLKTAYSGWTYGFLHYGARVGGGFDDIYGVKVIFNGNIDYPENAGGFYVSGNYVNTNSNDTFIIGKSANIKAGAGIYAAGYANWDVAGNFDGYENAIEIRAGNLNITGGTYKASYIPTTVQANGNGGTSLGVAIAVAQHTTKLPINVNISGGEFSAYTPINEVNPQENDSEAIDKVKVTITGGVFKTIDKGTNSVYSEDETKFITGGTYNKKVDDSYIADGYSQYESNGEYKILKINTLDDKEISNTLKSSIDAIIKSISENAEVKGIDEETKTAIETAQAAGKEISTQLELKEINDKIVDNTQKEKIASKLEENQKIGTYFDIDVVVKADNDKIGKVTELPNKLKITVKLPDELLDVDNGYTRKYHVIRLHEGKVETLDTTLNDDKTLTFESDQFSLYAIAYEDVLNKTEKENIEENPNTGDNFISYLAISIFSIVGLIVIKNKNN